MEYLNVLIVWGCVRTASGSDKTWPWKL